MFHVHKKIQLSYFFTQEEHHFSLYHAATGTVDGVNLPVVFPSVWL